ILALAKNPGKYREILYLLDPKSRTVTGESPAATPSPGSQPIQTDGAQTSARKPETKPVQESALEQESQLEPESELKQAPELGQAPKLEREPELQQEPKLKSEPKLEPHPTQEPGPAPAQDISRLLKLFKIDMDQMPSAAQPKRNTVCDDES